MPHDVRGNLLKPGDTVMVPFRVLDVFTGEEYCNVNLESLLGMPPEGHKTTLSAINTRQVLRANFGDDYELSHSGERNGSISTEVPAPTL